MFRGIVSQAHIHMRKHTQIYTSADSLYVCSSVLTPLCQHYKFESYVEGSSLIHVPLFINLFTVIAYTWCVLCM